MKLKQRSNRDGASGQRPRRLILCVEDDRANSDVVRLNLRRKYDLLFADSDREACGLLVEHHRKIDTILMDIELQNSGLNGVELTKLIRGKLDRADLPDYAKDVPQMDTPVIFVTAYGSKYARSLLDAAGGNGVINKPVDFPELEMAMAKVNLQEMYGLLKKSGQVTD